MKIRLILLVLVPLFSKAQDTICVTRSEMIHYASNAIELKNCKENFNLITLDLQRCQSLLNECNAIILKNDSLLFNQSIQIDKLNSQLKKETKRKKTWRSVSISSLGAIGMYFFIKHKLI